MTSFDFLFKFQLVHGLAAMSEPLNMRPPRERFTQSPADLMHLRHVEKQYGSRRAVFIEDLMLRQGDRLMIYGTNGSGKSTLLRLVAGITQPRTGSLWRAKSHQDEIVGYVPQTAGLYPEFSVRDNLVIRQRLYGQTRCNPEEEWYVREFGLSPLLDSRFGELSGGYQRLAAIASALICNPTWLLLDEPFAGVDTAKRSKVLENFSVIIRDTRLLVISGPTRQDFPQINRWIGMEEGQIVCQEP